MNHIELNAILFYADYLSLQATSQPVTDNCKYFYIHGVPINSAYIVDMEPVYDTDNPYFKQAMIEYSTIRDKFGEEAVESFVEDICCIRACGSVDAYRMLNRIHQYSSKQEKKQAIKNYNNWKKSLFYSHTTINEDGDPQQKECSKYIYYAERMLGKPGLARGIREN